jgi:hypothetical protein
MVSVVAPAASCNATPFVTCAATVVHLKGNVSILRSQKNASMLALGISLHRIEVYADVHERCDDDDELNLSGRRSRPACATASGWQVRWHARAAIQEKRKYPSALLRIRWIHLWPDGRTGKRTPLYWQVYSAPVTSEHARGEGRDQAQSKSEAGQKLRGAHNKAKQRRPGRRGSTFLAPLHPRACSSPFRSISIPRP